MERELVLTSVKPCGGHEEVPVRSQHVAEELLDPESASIEDVPNSAASVEDQLPALDLKIMAKVMD